MQRRAPPLERISFSGDAPNGPAFCYTRLGVLLYEEHFSEGLLVKGSYYNAQGEKISHIEEGTGQRAEFEEEHLVRLVSYHKGRPEGLIELFTPQGFLIASYYQKNGKKHGEEKVYYPRQSAEDPVQVKILLHWQEDVLQGVIKTWFLDGKQESQKEMYQNKKNGPSYAWYKQGDILLVEEYENDLLISGSYYKKKDKRPVSTIVQGRGVATLYDPEGYFLKKIPYEKGLPVLDTASP